MELIEKINKQNPELLKILEKKYIKETNKKVKTKVRAKPCGPKLIEKIMEQGIESWIRENKLLRNWKRNKKLIELSKLTIPESVWNNTIKKYDLINKKSVNFIKILQYLRKNKFKTLQNYSNNFILPKEKEKTILESFNF